MVQQLEQQRARFEATQERSAGDPKALAQAFGELGMLYNAYELLPAARACYLHAQALAPAEGRWTYYLAQVDRNQGAFEPAADELTRFLDLEPDYGAGWVWLGLVRLDQDRPDDAELALGRALALEPTDAAALYTLGRVESLRGRTEAAIQRFEEALAIQPSASVIRYPLGLAYQRQGRAEEARAQFERRGRRQPALSDPLLQELDDLATGARVHLFRGAQAMRARNLPTAVAEFDAAVVADPESSSARLNLGAALAQSGQVDRAIAELDKALELGLNGENLSKTHFNLGALHAMAGRIGSAEEHLRQALRWNPGNQSARAMLDRLEAARGDSAAGSPPPSP